MSEAKFTKGPWIVYGDLPTDVVVAQSGECSLATLDCGCGGRTTQRANAHLIAAAPDLYEALSDMVEQAVSCFYNHYGHEQDPSDLPMPEHIEKARTALAKARGEA